VSFKTAISRSPCTRSKCRYSRESSKRLKITISKTTIRKISKYRKHDQLYGYGDQPNSITTQEYKEC
jgi:hypothetical protein